ncbi:MAG: pyridoxamine 5'-phosphate oxidase family protein [Methylocystaceae bacterium]|nr:pyridoxamine 5'-phosphate oxidase family protein [Methylocystaceae bacterium]
MKKRNPDQPDMATIAHHARTIVRTRPCGTIGTLDRNDGTPYVSLCAHGVDFSANPIFLLSNLADHTQNIAVNNRISFLCEQASHLGNPQAGPRVSLTGRIHKINKTQDCTFFLQRHPSAKKYADFGDFNFYKMDVEKAHYVGGFGRAIWLTSQDYAPDSAASLNFSNSQHELIQHLNTDFPDFAQFCATKLLKHRGKNWQLLRVDSDGIDLKGASRIVRYPFEKQLKTSQEMADFLKKLQE